MSVLDINIEKQIQVTMDSLLTGLGYSVTFESKHWTQYTKMIPFGPNDYEALSVTINPYGQTKMYIETSQG